MSKKKKKLSQLLSGLGFIIIGLYMMLYLKDVKGQLPFWIGIGIMVWRI